METRITVNGVEYHSVEEMPPEVRAEYDRMMSLLADRDGDGVPDVLQSQLTHESTRSTKSINLIGSVSKVSTISVNGKQYDRLKDVPPELRQLIDRARASRTAKTTIIETRKTSPIISVTDGSSESGGITFRVTWGGLFAVLTAIGLVVVGYWLMH
jgi:hypothetical protein